VVRETVQQGESEGASPAKMRRPVFESDVGGDEDRAALVAFGDDPKERLSTALIRGQISRFVIHQDLPRAREGATKAVIGNCTPLTDWLFVCDIPRR
jgi:hypothetical protein